MTNVYPLNGRHSRFIPDCVHVIMTKKIEKLQSKIAGKKGRKGFLHEKSRDAQRLHRGQVRAERLERIANARAKKDQPVRMFKKFD